MCVLPLTGLTRPILHTTDLFGAGRCRWQEILLLLNSPQAHYACFEGKVGGCALKLIHPKLADRHPKADLNITDVPGVSLVSVFYRAANRLSLSANRLNEDL